MSRRLELVTDFAELGPGIDVVIMPCGTCGSTHDSRLGLGSVAANGLPGWEFVPPPSCIGLPMLCTSLFVKNRRVYRVFEDDPKTTDRVLVEVDEL